MADDNKQILIDISIDGEALKKSRENALSELATIDKKLADIKAKRKKDLDELERAISSGNQSEAERIQKNITLAEAESKSIQQSRREQIKIVQLSNDLLTQSDGKTLQSKEQLRKARQLEQIQLDQLKGTIAENAQGQIVLSKAGEQSVQALNKYNTGLIEFGKSVNDGRNNVGNYTNSIIEAVDKTGLLGGSLGTVRDAFNAVRSGAAGVKEGLDQFKSGMKESVSAVQGWFVTNTDANDSLSETSTVATTATESVKKVGVAGVSSMRALTAAIASTGIGLLVIALGAAFNYLRQVDPIVEKFEQLFSGLSEALSAIGKGVVDFGKDLINGLKNPIELLQTLNPINVVKRFSEVGSEAVKAGKSAADLTARVQELEDTERNLAAAVSKNNIEAEKNRRLSEDRTKSAKERLQFLELAQNAELKNLELEKQLAAQRLSITNEEVRQKKELGTVSDELLKKQIDQSIALNELNAKIQNKAAIDASDGAKLRLKVQKDYLSGVIAILNEELRANELNGTATIELKKRIIKQQRDADLSESEISNEQRIAIERKYRNDLLELEQETEEKRRDFQKQIDELAINRITDGRTKELAQEAISLQAKLDAIKGNSDQEKQLRERLIEDSARTVLDINRKYDELSLKERADVSKKNLDLITSDIEKGYKKQTDALDIALAGQEITQEEYNNRVAALNEAKLQELVGQQLKYQADRQTQDAQFYQDELTRLDEKLRAGVITQQGYNDEKLLLDKEYAQLQGQTEIETQAGINQTLNELDLQRNENEKNNAAERLRIKQEEIDKKAAIEQALLGVVGASIQAMGDLLSQDEKNRKKNAGVLKGLAAGEILLNLYQEIANYWKAESTKGAAGAIIAGGLTAAATIRAVAALAKVNAQKFAVGGFTTYSQHQSSFSSGGRVNAPRFGIIGEAGSEWVAPNWQMRDPYSAPMIERLERYRQTRIPEFAQGGYTVQSYLYNTPTITAQQSPMITSDFIDAVTMAVMRGMELSPAPIVSVQEITDVNQRSVNVRQSATL